MDQVSFTLPIRLVPRVGGQLWAIAMQIFVIAFSVVWMAMAGASTWFNSDEAEHRGILTAIFPLFGLLLFGSGVAGLVKAIAKILPGSPFHHVQVSTEGLTVRTMRRRLHFTWHQLSPFDVSVRVSNDGEGGRSTTHYIVALRAADATHLANENERYNRAIVRIDGGEFGDDTESTNAADLAAWLNGLRDLALDRRLSAQTEVSVPPGIRSAVRRVAGPIAALAKPQRVDSVVRR